jgi:hypothetical protein
LGYLQVLGYGLRPNPTYACYVCDLRHNVTPAEAGVQASFGRAFRRVAWMPAFAGMT